MTKYIFSILLSSLFFTACRKVEMQETITPAAFSVKNNPDVIFYALANGITLDKYNATAPETILNSTTITGMQANETILSMDFRPATGQLYGLGSTSRLYVINPESGVARMVGTGPLATPIVGTTTGFDFNPTVDRIRIVTSSGQNFRANPETGAVVMPLDGNINNAAGGHDSSGSLYK